MDSDKFCTVKIYKPETMGFEVVPNVLDFGKCLVNNFCSKSMEIKAPDDPAIEPVFIICAGDKFPVFSPYKTYSRDPYADKCIRDVYPGGIEVYFNPEEPIPYSDFFYINIASGGTIVVPTRGVRYTPGFSVEPSEINFESVPLRKLSSRIVTVSNHLEVPWPVVGVSVVGGNGNFSVNMNGGNKPCGSSHSVLDPKDYCTFSVMFNPQSLGLSRGKVEVAFSNAPLAPRKEYVELTGVGVTSLDPDVTVKPARWNFDLVSVGDFDYKRFIITNWEKSDLHVSNIYLSGSDEVQNVFSLNVTNGRDACGLVSFTLKTGESCGFLVKFSPKDEGNFERSVTVVFNDPDTSEFHVQLEGEGGYCGTEHPTLCGNKTSCESNGGEWYAEGCHEKGYCSEKEPPRVQRVGIWNSTAEPPVKREKDKLKVFFNYNRPVTVLVGVMSQDFSQVWWLGSFCSLGSSFGAFLNGEKSRSCGQVGLPVDSGWVFWLVTDQNLADLDWERGGYELMFYEF